MSDRLRLAVLPPESIAAKVTVAPRSRITSRLVLEANKQAEIDSRTPEFIRLDAGKPFYSGAEPWLAWATVASIFASLGVRPGTSVLDVGVGPGWTSLLLAESGYEVLGVDIVPANIELSSKRAARWGNKAEFALADMDDLALDRLFDHALVVDALHHSLRQRDVLDGIARHVRPGGWLVLGEPGLLHVISPGARKVTRELGWVERGIGIRALRRDLARAGFKDAKRFVQPVSPAAARPASLLWQLGRYAGGMVGMGPSMHNWLAARKA